MNIYDEKYTTELKKRIENLTPTSTPLWGKMTVDQMLAHLNVAYDMSFTDRYPKPNLITQFILKLFVKNAVVGPKPYPKNGRTAPQFIITGAQNFEEEKKKLISYIDLVKTHGASYFEGKKSHSFGALTAQEWNVMFGKHMDHHLTQFGV